MVIKSLAVKTEYVLNVDEDELYVNLIRITNIPWRKETRMIVESTIIRDVYLQIKPAMQVSMEAYFLDGEGEYVQWPEISGTQSCIEEKAGKMLLPLFWSVENLTEQEIKEKHYLKLADVWKRMHVATRLDLVGLCRPACAGPNAHGPLVKIMRSLCNAYSLEIPRD